MGLPPGVTLQQIDGGPSYYTSNGFTQAANAGWDNPSFFPVGVWETAVLSGMDITRWQDLHLNCAFQLTDNSDLALFGAGPGIWAIVTSYGTGNDGTNPAVPDPGPSGAETVGYLAADEPDTFPQWQTGIQQTPNADQDTRFWWVNNTFQLIAHNSFGGDDAAEYLATQTASPGGRERYMDWTSIDFYWFSYATDMTWQGYGAASYQISDTYLSEDEMARGCHYGDMIDFLRAYQTPPGNRPIVQFVENGGPDATVQTTQASYIQPPQMNQAVWSSVIHGARGICYFNTTFAGPGESQDCFGDTYYQTPYTGQAVSIYQQAKTTNALIAELAPVINSPTALGYFTVTPPPVVLAGVTSVTTPDSGIDAMAKYYQGGYGPASGFYIFATTRDSQTATGISATFTTADHYSGPVTVVNESRTVTAAGGVFTDTFATGAAVHIYQIPLQGGTPVETFANQPSTTVSSGGTSAPSPGTVESWTVASSASFPAAATGATQFHVCDTASASLSEIILVTNVSGTTWTVTRGAESTTPVTHTAGFTVQQVVTAGFLGNVLTSVTAADSSVTVSGSSPALAVSSVAAQLTQRIFCA